MKQYVDGRLVECTANEIEEAEKQARLDKIEENRRPLTTEEVTAMLITQQVNALTVDDNTALRMKSFYPTFDSIVGQTVKQGFKFTYADKLWSVAQAELVIQSHYLPGTGKESLYTEVCESHAGTLDDSIPYSGNMVLTNGLYYIEDSEIYLCFRDTVNPVHNPLAELVGLYVEKV